MQSVSPAATSKDDVVDDRAPAVAVATSIARSRTERTG